MQFYHAILSCNATFRPKLLGPKIERPSIPVTNAHYIEFTETFDIKFLIIIMEQPE